MASKDVEMAQEIGKLLTKGSADYKQFIKFWKHNVDKGDKLQLAVDSWTLWSQEQIDSIKGDKLKLLKPKYFWDEKSFLELAKEHKKYSDVGGVRHYYRFDDFTQSDLSKKLKIKNKTDYLKTFVEKPAQTDNEDSKNSNSNESSLISKVSESDSNAPFAKSAKVFDDEVYVAFGRVETGKIRFIKGQVAALKEKLFATEKQLEGVQNVLFLALKKLGLVDPNARSPFESEVADLWYNNDQMTKLNQAATQSSWVAKIIDELKGKETKGNLEDDQDFNDYEIYDNEGQDYIMDAIRQQEELTEKRKCDN